MGQEVDEALLVAAELLVGVDDVFFVCVADGELLAGVRHELRYSAVSQ